MCPDTYVTAIRHSALTVQDDDRDRVVLVQHLQHQAQIRVLIRLAQRLHRFCPDLHSAPLLPGKVISQEMGYNQRGDGNDDCCHYQEYLYLPDSVCPLHIFHLTTKRVDYCMVIEQDCINREKLIVRHENTLF